MSTLFVNNLNTASGTTITIPTGKTLKSTDTPIVGAGNIIQVLSQEITAYTGTTSTSMVATVPSKVSCHATSCCARLPANRTKGQHKP